MHLQNFASKIFFDLQTRETTSNLFPFVWETWIILTRNRLLVDIFLTRRLSKSLAFCEFASVMYGCVWLCRAMYGYVWRCRAVYGYVWLCMAMYGYVGLCMAVYGYVGLCRAMSG